MCGNMQLKAALCILTEKSRNEDMRDRFSDSCLEVALTNKRLPYHCRETFMNGEGLSQKHVNLILKYLHEYICLCAMYCDN